MLDKIVINQQSSSNQIFLTKLLSKFAVFKLINKLTVNTFNLHIHKYILLFSLIKI